LKPITPHDGLVFEKRFFGKEASFDPKNLAAFKRGDGYESFRFCLDEVRREQESVGWNPALPSTQISTYWFEQVKANLGKRGDKLRLYCAIGSRLDFFHGIDGFFELDGQIFTFDIKAGRNSRGKESVDLVIRKQANLYKFFRQISRDIADKLKSS